MRVVLPVPADARRRRALRAKNRMEAKMRKDVQANGYYRWGGETKSELRDMLATAAENTAKLEVQTKS